MSGDGSMATTGGDENETITPTDTDVLCGRGGSINTHPGNETFRQLVERRKRVYLTARFKREKRLIAEAIVKEIRSQDPPGRFLAKQGSKTSDWHDIGDVKARDKTSQALRENAPSIRKEIEVENDAKREQMRQEEEAEAAEAHRQAPHGGPGGAHYPPPPHGVPPWGYPGHHAPSPHHGHGYGGGYPPAPGDPYSRAYPPPPHYGAYGSPQPPGSPDDVHPDTDDRSKLSSPFDLPRMVTSALSNVPATFTFGVQVAPNQSMSPQEGGQSQHAHAHDAAAHRHHHHPSHPPGPGPAIRKPSPHYPHDSREEKQVHFESPPESPSESHSTSFTRNTCTTPREYHNRPYSSTVNGYEDSHTSPHYGRDPPNASRRQHHPEQSEQQQPGRQHPHQNQHPQQHPGYHPPPPPGGYYAQPHPPPQQHGAASSTRRRESFEPPSHYDTGSGGGSNHPQQVVDAPIIDEDEDTTANDASGAPTPDGAYHSSSRYGIAPSPSSATYGSRGSVASGNMSAKKKGRRNSDAPIIDEGEGDGIDKSHHLGRPEPTSSAFSDQRYQQPTDQHAHGYSQQQQQQLLQQSSAAGRSSSSSRRQSLSASPIPASSSQYSAQDENTRSSGLFQIAQHILSSFDNAGGGWGGSRGGSKEEEEENDMDMDGTNHTHNTLDGTNHTHLTNNTLPTIPRSDSDTDMDMDGTNHTINTLLTNPRSLADDDEDASEEGQEVELYVVDSMDAEDVIMPPPPRQQRSSRRHHHHHHNQSEQQAAAATLKRARDRMATRDSEVRTPPPDDNADWQRQAGGCHNWLKDSIKDNLPTAVFFDGPAPRSVVGAGASSSSANQHQPGAGFHPPISPGGQSANSMIDMDGISLCGTEFSTFAGSVGTAGASVGGQSLANVFDGDSASVAAGSIPGLPELTPSSVHSRQSTAQMAPTKVGGGLLAPPSPLLHSARSTSAASRASFSDRSLMSKTSSTKDAMGNLSMTYSMESAMQQAAASAGGPESAVSGGGAGAGGDDFIWSWDGKSHGE